MTLEKFSQYILRNINKPGFEYFKAIVEDGLIHHIADEFHDAIPLILAVSKEKEAYDVFQIVTNNLFVPSAIEENIPEKDE